MKGMTSERLSSSAKSKVALDSCNIFVVTLKLQPRASARHVTSVGNNRALGSSRLPARPPKRVSTQNLEMENGDDPGDAFAIPNFWSQPQFFAELQDPPPFLFSKLNIPGMTSWITSQTPFDKFPDPGGKIIYDIPDLQSHDGFFGELNFSFDPPSEPSTPSSATESLKIDENPKEVQAEKETFDIWKARKDDPPKAVQFLSWDAFENGLHGERYSAYITEAGPEIFDAALADENDVLHAGNKDYVVVQSQVYAESLVALGLGRSSVLFTWNEDKKSFEPALDLMRISGCTGETVNGLVATFMNCGNKTRALQAYVDKIYVAHKSAGRIALADAVSTLLSVLQSHLNVPRTSLKSFVQIQAFFRPAETLLTSFHATVESASLAKSDEALLSNLFEKIQQLEHTTDSMRDVLLEVLARVSRPFLDFAGEWLGLQREAGLPLDKSGTGRSFVKVEDRSWVDEQGLEILEPDFGLDTSGIPVFLPAEDAHTMFETGKSLRFLRTHHPEHPLSRADVISTANPPTLQWNFSWADIQKVEQKALLYEKDLTKALKQFSISSKQDKIPVLDSFQNHNRREIDIFSKSAEEVEALFLASMATLNQPLSDVVSTDRLSTLLTQFLASNQITNLNDESMFAPPISLTPIFSFSPIIAAQARIVNGTSMRLFFKSHNLREHLSIQRRFQLMGDGVFSSRLAHALFDPDLETAERQAGVARTGGIMGLRLGGRDTWPPASSELRLALMGVLTETYLSQQPDGSENTGGYLDRTREMPGDLSFAIREMTKEEIEKCIDPNSVEALDFLRLSYKPPAPLEAVITPLALYKYDQIFKLLLRVTRMLYVVSQLFRDATSRMSYWRGVDTTGQRFRIEAHHFITCVCGYFFDTGIDATWTIFERKLDQIEERIDGEADFAILGQNEGLDKLREYHERVLDRIMFALLLRKRQQAVLKLLDEIFGLILSFAKYSRWRAAGVMRKVGQDEEVKMMYVRFRRKVDVFITVCKGLSERKGYGERGAATWNGKFAARSAEGGLFDSDELVEENTVVQLLARLEMSNYYSQPIKL